jgi:hypothetical protein
MWVAMGGYAAWCLWSPIGRKWLRREPPRYLHPILVFWGLTPDASGYERMIRNQCALLLVLTLIVLAVLIVGVLTRG